MNKDHLRELITLVLEELDLYSRDAVELLMLTAAQESRLGHYLKQLHRGPALGIFQMEPATESDIWLNYLRFRPDLQTRVSSMMGNTDWKGLQMFGNLLYQIAMARVHYLRVSDPLPSRLDVKAMAKYYKDYYNTRLGKATASEAIKNYRRLCL